MEYSDIEIPAWEIIAAFAKVGLTATVEQIAEYGTGPRKLSKLYEDLSVIEAKKTIEVQAAYQQLHAVPDADNIRYWLTQPAGALADFVKAGAKAWKVPQYGDYLPNGGATPNHVQWRSFAENGVMVDKEISDGDYAQALYSDALAAHLAKAKALNVDPYTGNAL